MHVPQRTRVQFDKSCYIEDFVLATGLPLIKHILRGNSGGISTRTPLLYDLCSGHERAAEDTAVDVTVAMCARANPCGDFSVCMQVCHALW